MAAARADRGRLAADGQFWGLSSRASAGLLVIPFAGALLVGLAALQNDLYYGLVREDRLLEWLQFDAYVATTVFAVAAAVRLERGAKRLSAVTFAAVALCAPRPRAREVQRMADVLRRGDRSFHGAGLAQGGRPGVASGRRARRSDLRGFAALAGDAPRGPDRDSRSVPLCGERRRAARRRQFVRARADRRGRPAPAGAAVGGVRDRRALRAGPLARRDRARGDPASGQALRRRGGGRPGDVPAGGRRPPAGERDPGTRRPRAVRRPPSCEERRGARGHPSRSARRRGCDGRGP